ncbi:MAG TPA: proline dehydrogenase family protein [Nitrososphaerales archaeon]|nr:proline dehydrogenase family protein [Nitrososphaerales archaeon]
MAGILLRLARQWIAGETAQDGIERAKKANSRGILGLLNLLGEHIESKDQISNTLSEYEKLLDLISENKVQSQISIKPTQVGLNIDFDYCLKNYFQIAEACKAHSDNWLWIDMENSPYTQKTIDLYSKVLSSYPNTGIAIQAYMRRSEKDLKELLPLGAKIRLVKGAYNEHPEIVFKDKKAVRENFSKLQELLFAQQERNFFAIATHDSALIEKSKELSKTNKSDFEYEMLLGVRDKLKFELVSEHYQVREYIPYGPEWLPYSLRRIREKKSNIFLLLRSLFSS